MEINKHLFSPYEKEKKEEYETALRFMKTIRNKGYVCYFTGECVRNALLQKTEKTKLFEISTNMKIGTLRCTFRTYVEMYIPDTIFILYKAHIFLVYYNKQDHLADARRIFTINSIYYDPFTFELSDPCLGIEDIAARNLIFIEDYKEEIKKNPQKYEEYMLELENTMKKE